jgi:hypothetical protein
MGAFFQKISGDRFNLLLCVCVCVGGGGITAIVGSVLSKRWGKEDV